MVATSAPSRAATGGHSLSGAPVRGAPETFDSGAG